MNELVRAAIVALVALAVLLGLPRSPSTRMRVFVLLAWIAPVLYGLLFVFRQRLEQRLGLHMMLPVILIPAFGVLLAAIGTVLLLRQEPRGAARRRLVRATLAALSPALALSLFHVLDVWGS